MNNRLVDLQICFDACVKIKQDDVEFDKLINHVNNQLLILKDLKTELDKEAELYFVKLYGYETLIEYKFLKSKK